MDMIEPAADEDPTPLAALPMVWSEEPIRSRLDGYLDSRGLTSG
jgi:hypothetical protein